MTSRHNQRTGEGYDKPRSPEWYAAVKAEARSALERVRIRDAAAREARTKARAEQVAQNRKRV